MDRRDLLQTLTMTAGAGAIGGVAGSTAHAQTRKARSSAQLQNRQRPFIETRDGTNLFYRDWGSGPPVVLAAPWALTSDWWEYQMAYLTDHGLRCISYDRRGHGRSGEPGYGYDFDTLADDLAALIEQLDLHEVTLVGHSMGTGEVVHYLARQRARRVARAVLISTITPFTLRAPDNPNGVEFSVLEEGRQDLARNRPQQVAKAAPPFFGTQKNAVAAEIMEWWTRMILDQCSLKVMLDLHRMFTAFDFRPDLSAITVPVLMIHGDIDTSTPIDFTARRTVPLIPKNRLVVYENAAHGLPITHMDRLNGDLLAFALGQLDVGT